MVYITKLLYQKTMLTTGRNWLVHRATNLIKFSKIKGFTAIKEIPITRICIIRTKRGEAKGKQLDLKKLTLERLLLIQLAIELRFQRRLWVIYSQASKKLDIGDLDDIKCTSMALTPMKCIAKSEELQSLNWIIKFDS